MMVGSSSRCVLLAGMMARPRATWKGGIWGRRGAAEAHASTHMQAGSHKAGRQPVLLVVGVKGPCQHATHQAGRQISTRGWDAVGTCQHAHVLGHHQAASRGRWRDAATGGQQAQAGERASTPSPQGELLQTALLPATKQKRSALTMQCMAARLQETH